MQAIDRWVIRSVFAALRDPDTVMPSGSVAINLSGQSLSDRQFLEFVEQQIEACAVVLERICFEITETAAISNLSLAKRFFSALKPRGCRFALDDFGSGLSSFAYLKTSEDASGRLLEDRRRFRERHGEGPHRSCHGRSDP
ncbi:MAG: EAL domain-containing protein [Gammaproteobacteria bacterium]